MLESTDPIREILVNNSLRISAVDANTIGRFACHVSNDLGTVTSRQALVQMARELLAVIPVIMRFMWWVCLLGLNGSNQPNNQMVTKSEGDSLKLDCGEYSSLPEATVTWVRRHPLTDVQRQSLGDNVVASVESGILFFRNLTTSHDDLYQCSITNSLTGSNIVGSYRLVVNGKLFGLFELSL